MFADTFCACPTLDLSKRFAEGPLTALGVASVPERASEGKRRNRREDGHRGCLEDMASQPHPAPTTSGFSPHFFSDYGSAQSSPWGGRRPRQGCVASWPINNSECLHTVLFKLFV